MIFLFPRWDMLIPWRVYFLVKMPDLPWAMLVFRRAAVHIDLETWTMMNQDISRLFSSGTFLSPGFGGCLPKGFWVSLKYMISPSFFWHGYFKRNHWFYWPSMLRNHYAISCNLFNVFATVCIYIYIHQNICIPVCSYTVYNPPITGVCCATNLLPATTRFVTSPCATTSLHGMMARHDSRRWWC